MKDEQKTRKQLIRELKELRRLKEFNSFKEESPSFKSHIKVNKFRDDESELVTSPIKFKNSSSSEEGESYTPIKFKNIIDGSPVPQFVIDKNHRIIHWNRALEEYSGIKESEVLGTNQQWRAFYSMQRPCLADLLVEGATHKIDEWYHDKYKPSDLIEGAFEATDFFSDMMGGVWLYFTASTIKDDDGQVVGAVETLTDVTKRKNAEKALINSESKYRSVIENIQDVFYRSDNQGNLVMVSPSVRQLLGYEVEESLNKPIAETFYVNSQDRLDFLRELEKEGSIQNYEVTLKRKDGSVIPVETSSHYYYDEEGKVLGIEGIFRDITERKEAENQLKNSLKEKEILLKEIHHRVKNNMQIVYSLLSLQSECIEDPRYKTIFIENQNRVKSISVIHEKLYLSPDFSNIDFTEYLNSLIIEIFISYGVDMEKIKVDVKNHNLKMGMDTAIPCGLILNELITNSIRHAFPYGKGLITIDLQLINGRYVLIFSDDGVGIAPEIDFHKSKTLGLQLIKTLVKQLEGTIELDTRNGTEYIISFNELKYKERLFDLR